MKTRKSFSRAFLMIGALIVAFSVPAWSQTGPASRLRYAQAANGQTGSQTYVTTLLVSNPNNFAVQAFIDTFDDANPANPMGLGLGTNCQFDPATNNFTIPKNSSCLFVSDGGVNPDGSRRPLKTGWLRASEASGNNVIGGYLAFTLHQGIPATGFPLFTVGVSPTPRFSQFSVPVVRDVPTNQDIGFAMSNPFGDGPSTVTAQLVNASGSVAEQQDITLPAFAHMARFLSQMFPATLGSAVNFVGNLFVTAKTSNDAVIATALIQQGNQFGGAPPTTNALYLGTGKKADALDQREANEMPREHEKISATAISPLF